MSVVVVIDVNQYSCLMEENESPPKSEYMYPCKCKGSQKYINWVDKNITVAPYNASVVKGIYAPSPRLSNLRDLAKIQIGYNFALNSFWNAMMSSKTFPDTFLTAKNFTWITIYTLTLGFQAFGWNSLHDDLIERLKTGAQSPLSEKAINRLVVLRGLFFFTLGSLANTPYGSVHFFGNELFTLRNLTLGLATLNFAAGVGAYLSREWWIPILDESEAFRKYSTRLGEHFDRLDAKARVVETAAKTLYNGAKSSCSRVFDAVFQP